MMTLDEQKLAVCEKLPETVYIWEQKYWKGGVVSSTEKMMSWKNTDDLDVINWPLEGLQVCHEAEKLIRDTHMTIITNDKKHNKWLVSIFTGPGDKNAAEVENDNLLDAWLEALCRVWHPERFER